MSFMVEPDGKQHFDDMGHGPDAFALNRSHDLHKMRWALEHGLPVVRLMSRGIEYFNRSKWQAWLRHVRDTLIAPLADKPSAERRIIVLEDTPCYRVMFAECLKEDSQLGPHVIFCAHVGGDV